MMATTAAYRAVAVVVVVVGMGRSGNGRREVGGLTPPCHAGHSHGHALPLPGVVVLQQAEARGVGLQAPHRAPEPLAHPALGRHVLDQLEGLVELLPALRAEPEGRVGGGEEEHGDGRCQEVVVEDLDAAVHVRVRVEYGEVSDRLLGQVHGALSECGVIGDAGSRVENRRVQPDADLMSRLAKQWPIARRRSESALPG